MKPETQLIAAARQYLELRGFLTIRVNSGMVAAGSCRNARIIRMAEAGTSDLIACSPNGRFYALEAKVGKNKPTKLQDQFLARVRSRGGVGGVFWNLDDLQTIIDENEREAK